MMREDNNAEFLEQKNRLAEKIRERLEVSDAVTDDEVALIIDEVIFEDEVMYLWPVEERRRLRKELFLALRRLDVLQLFVEDKEVTEIMINGKDHIFVEKQGRLQELEAGFDSTEKLNDVIQKIVGACNRVVNQANPIVDARLEGSRVNVVLPPIAINGPILTIRRFPDKPITMEWLVRRKSITAEAAQFLETLVKAGYNIFVSGSTGSGKTTFLNALSEFISPAERVITVEDDAELQLLGLPNLVQLETRNANTEGCGEITIRDLIKTSLRMRPDRIIVGEVRGAEAVDMLQCMNTGHSSMSTGHANSAVDMLSRLENMVFCGMEIPLQAVRKQIASGIDILVHLGRLRDRSRRVLEIVELAGCENGEIVTNPLFQFQETGVDEKGNVLGSLQRVEELKGRTKLAAAGLSLL